ncbi:hypothetical protein J4401_07030 [Candidatus Woesearchaeota archaeon]|nr:hypothetical protein [Candidatus Woesearchaeota archaeon]
MGMNKKAEFSYYADWAEFFFFVLLFVGIVLGVLSPNAVITYLIATASGMLAGRVFHHRRYKGRAPYTLLIVGFIMGFVIGTFRGERTISFLLFVLGGVFSYYLFDKKILKDTVY